MEIIAQTNEGWILKSSKEEINNLLGYYFQGSEVANLHIGSDVRVATMFNQLYYLERNKRELKYLAEKLREYANNLEAVRPILVEEKTDGD